MTSMDIFHHSLAHETFSEQRKQEGVVKENNQFGAVVIQGYQMGRRTR